MNYVLNQQYFDETSTGAWENKAIIYNEDLNYWAVEQPHPLTTPKKNLTIWPKEIGEGKKKLEGFTTARFFFQGLGIIQMPDKKEKRANTEWHGDKTKEKLRC